MRRLGILVFLLPAAACSTYSLPNALGDQCELNSDCDAPLICRFGYCRVECASARDCAAGLDCLYDNMQRGACQLIDEKTCTRNSECPEGLVCTMGECTNPCGCGIGVVPCRDCPPGAACVANDEGGTACFDSADDVCVYDSDCEATAMSFICAPDERCRVECRSDADCRNGEACRPATFEEGDAGMVTGDLCIFVGTGTPDGGASDASIPDGGRTD
jgi:Cys-rich repeat protein